MRTMTDEQVKEAAEALQGTCAMGGIMQYAPEGWNMADEDAVLEYLHEHNINECACCGWYGYADEVPEGGLCDQCADDQDCEEEF